MLSRGVRRIAAGASARCRAHAEGSPTDGSSRSSRSSRRALLLTGAAAVVPVVLPAVVPSMLPARALDQAASAYDFVLEQNGKPFPLSYLRDKVTVFVNVASE